MKTIIEILIDNSRSMGPFQVEANNGQYLLPDGSTRMSFAKTVLLDEVLPTFDYASKIIVRKFHSNDRGNNDLAIETIYDRDFDYETLSQIINEIPDPIDTGGTPITDAIKYSIGSLAKYAEADRKIILVTDGEETGEGDYKKAANEALMLFGIPCNIFIIGIALTQTGEIKAKGLAEDTGGSYVNLQAKNYDKTTLQNKLRPLRSAAVAKSVENNTSPINIAQIPQTSPPSTLQSEFITPSVALPSLDKDAQTFASTPVQPIGMEPIENLAEPTSVIQPENDIKNENGASDYTDNGMKVFFAQMEQNTSAINVLSKQLGLISEEIKNLKTANEEDDYETEPVIKENAELNEKIRLASESFLFEKLKQKFGDRVVWLNEQKESGDNHDFEVQDSLDGSIEYFIECKGSIHADKVFYLTKNEWFFFLDNTKNYQLFFVANALNNPEIVKVDNFKDWLFKGKIVPFVSKNIKQKANRIVFSILE